MSLQKTFQGLEELLVLFDKRIMAAVFEHHEFGLRGIFLEPGLTIAGAPLRLCGQ